MSESCLVLVPVLPLVATLLLAVFGPALREKSHWPVVIATTCSFACALIVFGEVYQNGPFDALTGATWFEAGGVSVGLGLRADALSALMLLGVTFVGTFIAVFSAGYMHGDAGYPRYFTVMGLFLFSMLGLVLATNLLVLYACWEGVGLCSYLLVGYWYFKPAAAAAARKAFLVTRLGDCGLLLGIFLLWFGLGFSLDIPTLLDDAAARTRQHAIPPALATLACLLIFAGAAGKSAQFPLHVWLPDAMEGPTPVSALIHAATMVTAGVYLVARMSPLFLLSPAAQYTVAIVGAFTALLAALIALTQNDLKRVLAYSTVSQLGYMFLALGCVGFNPAGAVTAALFHLFTHAFFKALLFLGAGSVMHAMGDVIDMRRFSGLRALLPVTHATFLAGALALAGVPPFAGFFSKDSVLEVVLERAQHGPNPVLFWVLFGSAALTAVLTAFYTFRAYFKTFFGGQTVVPPEAGGHAHESPASMTLPLVVLAVGALGVGWACYPYLGEYTQKVAAGVGLPPAEHAPAAEGEAGHEPNWPLMVGSAVAALAGIAAAWALYGKADRGESVAVRVPAAYQASLNRFYLDDLYAAFLVRPLEGVGRFADWLDRRVDEATVLAARTPAVLGRLLAALQNGLVQSYAMTAMLGAAVVVVVLLLMKAR